MTVSRSTPMGATLVDGGVTVRTWAPHARDVYIVTPATLTDGWLTWEPVESARLTPLGDDTWAGFVPGLGEGDPYLFWVRGPVGGSEGFKRDPYARELAACGFPDCPCLVRSPRTYPWHDAGWRPHAFHELVIYQLHVGVFWSVDALGRDRRTEYGRFLDVVERLPYLQDLGVTAIQLLPVQEYDMDRGLGYANVDYFSPEMAYQVEDPGELARYLATVNGMLAARGLPPLTIADLQPGPNQLKCLVDLCHLHGLSVIFDLVYNHAGGGFGDRSLWFYDRQAWGDPIRSLYFTNKEWAGGMVFAYWQAPVRQLLIDNALSFLTEFRIDGIRYDEVTVIHHHGGDEFCRDLTSTARYVRPDALHIAEYWDWDRTFPATPAADGGLGFDAVVDDRLREAVRATLGEAAGGADAAVDLDRIAAALLPRPGLSAPWQSIQHLENHDVVLFDVWEQGARDLRIPLRADPTNPRSWHARSRTRVATTLLLTAPGIPMFFMGQEILEDKPWCDDVRNWAQFLLWWDGLREDRHMADFHRFVRDAMRLRRRLPALSGDGVRISQVHNGDRVLVMHRWVNGAGHDAVVVVSLNERTLDGYAVDLPWPGHWAEAFNSDYYDNYPNPWVRGNGGGVDANEPGRFGYPFAARVTIPANGALVFVRG
ncbi:MAG: alpha amylase C-terminal domain-containing protein [Vicinamibacterales bacterium]